MDDAIRAVLLEIWDPLGVGDNHNLKDEYNFLIPKIRAALLNGVSENDLTELLMEYDKKLGASEADFQPSNAAAKALLRLGL